MKYFDKAVYLLVCYFISTSPVFAQTGRNLALKLRGNVVHLEASFGGSTSRKGFGFVVGEKRDTLYIATAAHVVVDDNSVEGNKPRELKVKFYQIMGTLPGKVLWSNAKKDVATISVKKPDEYEWKKNCIDKHPKEGGKVYYIGKSGEWTVPTEVAAGGIKKIDDVENTISTEKLSIAPGSSGGPLLSKNGIIGVIRTHDTEGNPQAGGDAYATGLRTVKIIATSDRRYPYIYSLRSTKLSTENFIISGLGILGATGVILGAQQMNEAKTSDGYNYYKNHTNPESIDYYPYQGLSREELYNDANKKYKAGQVLVIGGSIAIAGAAVWLLIKEQVIKPKSKALTNLSVTPQVYWTDGSNGLGAKAIHVSYAF